MSRVTSIEPRELKRYQLEALLVAEEDRPLILDTDGDTNGGHVRVAVPVCPHPTIEIGHRHGPPRLADVRAGDHDQASDAGARAPLCR